MKNAFAQTRALTVTPNRNTFDESHSCNFTAKFGYLYPILCQEVLPGESFRISAAAQLNAMPLKFPVQTPIMAYFHYFLCRNRNVHEDWEDYITHVRDGIQSPWLRMTNERAKIMLQNGELADFLGVPTDFYGNYGNQKTNFLPHDTVSGTTEVIYKRPAPFALGSLTPGSVLTLSNLSLITVGSNINSYMYVDLNNFPYSSIKQYYDDDGSISDYYPHLSLINSLILPLGSFDSVPLTISCSGNYGSTNNPFSCLLLLCQDDHIKYKFNLGTDLLTRSTSSFSYNLSSLDLPDGSYDYYLIPFYQGSSGPLSNYGFINYFPPYDYRPTSFSELQQFSSVGSGFAIFDGYGSSGYISAVDDSVIADNPFVGTSPQQPISSIPFRHYEQIFNSFYRDSVNNPYFINGVQQFNEFIPSHASGPDDNTYVLHRRNWELDFLTSAVPTPQFGAAPLVGLTVNDISNQATLTFDVTDSQNVDIMSDIVSTGQVKSGSATVHASTTQENWKFDAPGKLSGQLTGNVDVKLGSDGETLVGISRYDNNVPPATLQRLFRDINYGISINDLRNVNSMQRYLENMQRVGSYKYADQLESHYGVKPDYKTIDLPSFEGGFSVPIGVRTVTQSAQTEVDSRTQHLGDIAGQINVQGNQDNDVQIYCPEHGFIFCIMSIVPIPSYSQLLPKYLTKVNSPLDYFTPEFGKINYQPINYNLVCPLQSARAHQPLTDVFGYQRPWYEYLQQYDRVHGKLRTNLRDFLVNRVFNSRPSLGEDFLLVDPKQVNDIFAVTDEDNDTFVGQVYFSIQAKRIIPRYGIAALE